jgi:hypothetical protein
MSSSPEAQIRSIISRYAQAVTAKDEALWASTWSESGVWELMGQAPEGREAVVAYWNSLMGGIPFAYQLPGEGSIEIDASGARGTGRVPTVEFAKFGDGPGMLMLGTYHDVYVLEAGEWLFGERRMRIQYMGPPDMSGTPAP